MSVKFDRQSAIRIGKATHEVERGLKNQRPQRRRQSLHGDLGFWARLTAGSGGWYSWVTLEPTSVGGLTNNADWGQGTLNAVESKYATQWAFPGEVVWMYPAKNYDYWLFEYNPGVKSAILVDGYKITARSGATPGSGTVGYQHFNGSIFVNATTGPVLNMFRTEIEADGDDLIIQCSYGDGWWWVTGVECSSDSGSSGSPGGS